MATVHDIAQVLATSLGLRTGAVMQHVRTAQNDSFLPDGEADTDSAILTLLTVIVSQLSESPDHTPDLAREFSELPLAHVKIWKAGQITDPLAPLDALMALIPTKTVAGFATQSFDEYLRNDFSDARYCAGISVGMMDRTPRVQIVTFPTNDETSDGLCYQFHSTGETPAVAATIEVTIAQPFYYLNMAIGVAEGIGAAVEPTHYDITTRRQ